MSEELAEMVRTMMDRQEFMIDRLKHLEKNLSLSTIKELYTTTEVAERLGRTEWTVRQWCNLGQAKAKKVHGRGRQGEWRIGHEELLRLQREGPLVIQKVS
jgi:hypothetical protein